MAWCDLLIQLLLRWIWAVSRPRFSEYIKSWGLDQLPASSWQCLGCLENKKYQRWLENTSLDIKCLSKVEYQFEKHFYWWFIKFNLFFSTRRESRMLPSFPWSVWHCYNLLCWLYWVTCTQQPCPTRSRTPLFFPARIHFVSGAQDEVRKLSLLSKQLQNREPEKEEQSLWSKFKRRCFNLPQNWSSGSCAISSLRCLTQW